MDPVESGRPGGLRCFRTPVAEDGGPESADVLTGEEEEETSFRVRRAIAKDGGVTVLSI